MEHPIHHRYEQAMSAGDAAGVRDALADDVRLHSPVTPKPFEGREIVARVLGSIIEVFDDLRFDPAVLTEPYVVLPFQARIGDRPLQGIDYLRFDDDRLICEFTVMVRPLMGLLALQNEMAPRLGADPLRLVPAGAASP
ncbi:MAG: nuclear transport factor 2 family protein [Solirubrobacteraceae bacterium]